MDNAINLAEASSSAENIETQEFKLEMLDCGPGYTYSSSDAATCFSCFCGSGCLCGCMSASAKSA